MNPVEEFLKIKEFVEKNYDKNELVAHYVWNKYRDKLKLLLAIIISVRNREEKTLEIVNCFFDKFKTIEELEKLINEGIIEECLKKGGLWRQKLNWIKKIIEIIKQKGYEILDDENELIKLPGVGRKVLNVYLQIALNKDVIGVDTHVHRIANLLGWVNTKTPEETEKELYKVFPKEYWKDINWVLVLFGRNVCKSKKPLCDICPIKEYCKNYNKKE